MTRVLVISAHPDDEVLGCGGTLQLHADRGDDLQWLIVTKAFAPRWSEETVRAKEAEVDAVAEAFGMSRVFWPGLEATRLADLKENLVIDTLRTAIEAAAPEWIYVVHPGDVHSDHGVVFNALEKVLKTFYQRERYGVCRVLAYETLSSTAAGFNTGPSFVPNVFRRLNSKHISYKIELMELYQSEWQDDPMPRGPSAIRALARMRGATIGVQFAEAFQLIREIQ